MKALRQDVANLAFLPYQCESKLSNLSYQRRRQPKAALGAWATRVGHEAVEALASYLRLRTLVIAK